MSCTPFLPYVFLQVSLMELVHWGGGGMGHCKIWVTTVRDYLSIAQHPIHLLIEIGIEFRIDILQMGAPGEYHTCAELSCVSALCHI